VLGKSIEIPMLELRGIAVSPGVAIGQVIVIDREGFRIARCRRPTDDVPAERQRLLAAIELAAEKLECSRQQTSTQLGSHLGDIFSAQRQMLLDPRLQEELEKLVETRQFSAEFAVSEVLNGYAEAFRRAPSTFLRERAADITDIERRLLECLGGQPTTTLNQISQATIIASHELTPGETAELNTEFVLGFCTEKGGPGGHTAIVARGLEIPAVVGMGAFLHRIRSEDTIIIDGYKGRVIVDPDEATREKYQQRRRSRQDFAVKLTEIRDLPATTSDGQRIELLANIEFPSEANSCLGRGAEGIGLYRTEFLYLGASSEPSEQEHFDAYVEVVRAMPNRKIILRTLDLGADKMELKSFTVRESNPFLGLRSIRMSLRNPSLFRTQIRAILRASVEGDVRIMFPMVTTLDELRSARMVVRSVADDLREEGIPVSDQVQIGIMIEVPAAVMMLDRFAKEVDFISIGTNDLTQYTLAVDRTNEAIADLYQAVDPSVLRMIQKCVEAGNAGNIEVSVCGDMSSDPASALLLVGLGIRVLSVPPASVPQIKKAIRSVSLSECQAMAWKALRLDTAREVDAFLQHQLAGLVPEMVVQD
jgi:phosphoenolpyruvate-protein phosphotransferase (PTS system enzyme I)